MTDGVEWVVVDAARLGYATYGAGPDKRPLIFLHGYAMRSTMGPYEELLQQLGRNYSVYGLDLRGHGASAEATGGWSFEALADDVVAFARALGLGKPVLVGHSFGAVVSLLAEIRHPGSFEALCLLSPGPADHRRDPVEALDFMIEHGHDKAALRGAFAPMFVRPADRLLDIVLDAATLIDSRVHRAQKAQDPHFSIEDQLQHVTAPVLLIRGGSDSVVAPARQHEMAERLPRVKEVAFSTEGHMMANESAPIVAREVFAFLDKDSALLGGAIKAP